MTTKQMAKPLGKVVFLVLLIVGSLGCGLSQTASTIAPEATGPVATAPVATATAPQWTEITGPEGMVLAVENSALTDDAEVTLEVLGESDLPVVASPFDPVGPEYRVDFGDGQQVGGVILKVPFSSLARLSAPAAPYAYAAWARPDVGLPSMVGVLLEGELASLPIVGEGRYQIVQIAQPVAGLLSVTAPLAVPTYPQMTPSWCSPTALTDLAGYHEGAWPSGGFGSVWGESSNWYLAGNAGQPYNTGYFFHWLLKAAGYSVPSDVQQSFADEHAEVIIWNWHAYQIGPPPPPGSSMTTQIMHGLHVLEQMTYAEELFDAFQAYVETQLWGEAGDRRPVAWGSSLAGHSRAITGSDGEDLFFNNPSSGSLNDSKSWHVYLQEILDSIESDSAKTEVIDTVVFYADPRPTSERRGVLWLLPQTESGEGSIVLRRAGEGTPAAYWHWDGSLAHDYGYYYEDVSGDLPPDPTFDAQLKAESPQDELEYGFAVRSISDGTYDYAVKIILWGDAGKVSFPETAATVEAGGRADFFPAGSFAIGDLDPGMYRLEFTLVQGGIVQDVKHVYFRVAPRGYIPAAMAEVAQRALCRTGPGTAYNVVTGFEPGRLLHLLGVNSERTWGKIEATAGESRFQCWIGLGLLTLQGDSDVPVLPAPPLPVATLGCEQYSTAQTCSQHSECTWNRLVVPGVCETK